ncbi:MAG: transglutaminase family protein [Acetobacteraceae bacterium]|nr:MAG: transglutaminase family protein [Acetobacteraceae bacterium]
MSSTIMITHRTEYRYDRPVILQPHRMMLRPRDGHDLWVDDALLTISPTATLRWYFDAFGNSIAEASFAGRTDMLLVESQLYLRRYVSDRLVQAEVARVCPFPFRYTEDDLRDLHPFLGLQNPEDEQLLSAWLAEKFDIRAPDAVTFLLGLSDAVHLNLGYSAREEMGTQTAAETIRNGVGTCRDFAFLFMEAARHFGFAARFVTGYLDDRQGASPLVKGGGATHAWADVYVPGEGWIEFDPTNRITAGRALIRVATTRTPSQASPISGSFIGEGAISSYLSVSVLVREVTATG